MFLKFIFSSLSSFLIDILLFSLFCLLFKESFPLYYAGIATVLARVLSATYNCLINYTFVFKSEQRLIKSIVKYFALAVCQMLVSALLGTAGTLLLTNIPATAIKIVIDLFLFFASYYIQNRYVFWKSCITSAKRCKTSVRWMNRFGFYKKSSTLFRVLLFIWILPITF